MDGNTYPYGMVRKLARAAGITPTWASKVLHRRETPSLELAMKLDGTGMVKGRSFVAEVLAATASKVA